MNNITLVVLAFGLAMDAFAVSISNSMCYKEYDGKEQIKTALGFGIFQGLMPVFGYISGLTVSAWMGQIDHWIAFFFLGLIGGKMIKDGITALRYPHLSCDIAQKVFTNKVLFIQAIATSIDAFAVGISFAALEVSIPIAAIIIMFVTFIVCLIGGKVGKHFGEMLSSKATLVGGLILLLIGLDILIEHLFG